jgi:hypothetical protein
MTGENRKLTRLKKLRRYHTLVLGASEGYRAILKIGSQSFTFASVETKREAEWYRDMMAESLNTLIMMHAFMECGELADRMKQRFDRMRQVAK